MSVCGEKSDELKLVLAPRMLGLPEILEEGEVVDSGVLVVVICPPGSADGGVLGAEMFCLWWVIILHYKDC